MPSLIADSVADACRIQPAGLVGRQGTHATRENGVWDTYLAVRQLGRQQVQQRRSLH